MSPELPRAAEAAARARGCKAPTLPPIPEPANEGRRQFRCPVPDCNRRFLSLDRYRLHWRTIHCPVTRRSTK